VRGLTRRQAWQRWQAAAGRWRGWSICPALITPTRVAAQHWCEKPAVADELSVAFAAELPADGGTALLLDLDPLLGVHVAATLNKQRAANAVLVLPRWPYADAILPVDDLVAALIDGAQHLSAIEDLPNVVFVIDAQRGQRITPRPESDTRIDNRYRLSSADLPDLAALRRAGIRHIVKVTCT